MLEDKIKSVKAIESLYFLKKEFQEILKLFIIHHKNLDSQTDMISLEFKKNTLDIRTRPHLP